MEGLVVLLVLWGLMSFLNHAAKGRRGGGAEGRPKTRALGGEAERRRATRAETHRPKEAEVADPLDAWRREMERLTGMRTGPDYGPLGRPSRVKLPGAEDVEEREVLGGEREARSLEVEGDRPLPEVVDQDEKAEAVIQRRLEVAEARLKGLTKADHLRFDQQVRAAAQPSPKPSRSPESPRGRLRAALVWKEILGEPVSLRDRP